MARSDLFRALLLALLAPLAAFGLAPGVAFADPEPEVSDDPEPEVSTPPSLYNRLLSVELIGGLDTPYGLIGGSVRLAPIDFLVIDAGAGVSRDGVRIAGGLSLVAPQDHFAFVFRIGAAGGPLDWESGGTQAQHRYWAFTAFIDASLGLEYRWDEGITGRIMVGVEDDIISDADSCRYVDGSGDCDPAGGSHPTRLYIGLAIGYAFDIQR
jgi:hypothetical protein